MASPYKTHPTRLPYGLSLSKPLYGANSNIVILDTATATPDCRLGSYFLAQASGPTITNFVGGERGKLLFLECQTGGVVILQNSAGGIRMNNIVVLLSGGAQAILTLSATAGNATMLNGETLGFVHDGTSWSLIGDRIAISTQV